MIEIARRKAADYQGATRFRFEVADCLALPFAEGSFDCVTVAYGVRNFERLLDGYREMYRVMKPGAVICVIELSTPVNPIVRPLYKIYTRTIIPLLGLLVSHDTRAYSYLPESIEAVAQGSEMTALMSEAGFVDARFRRLTFGVCTIYTAIHP
jgi:demethylmenaquinone methyltransferase/2-methoxy-6-polyprenyl-1,4-benzoquinol methylase